MNGVAPAQQNMARGPSSGGGHKQKGRWFHTTSTLIAQEGQNTFISADPFKGSQIIYIRQHCQWHEEIIGWESNNNYSVFLARPGSSDLKMTDHEIQALPLAYQVPENSGACCRQCCGPARSFKMMVRDPTNPHHPLIRMRRPWACNVNVAGLCVCCPSTMFVSTGEYHPIGSVAQSERCFDCHKWLDVMGPDDHKVFDLRAGCCACGPNWCCRRYVFDIIRPRSGNKVGEIANVYPGVFSCKPARADNLQIVLWNDGQGISNDEKALLLAAVFQIDFLYFEKRGESQDGVQVK